MVDINLGNAVFRADVAVRDFVLPICDITIKSGTKIDKDKSNLAGTSFLIGARGYALTAAHVVDQTTDGRRTALKSDVSQHWLGFEVLEVEKHPTEDVAILKFAALPGELPLSPLFVNGNKEFSSKKFHMWGYPESVAREVETHNLPADYWKIRPDLTFFQGYVRRRMSFSPNPSFSSFVGKVFYEISELGGSCASGSPIIGENPMRWDVFAMYVGESTGSRNVGYGLSLETIADWSPTLLGHTIREEANSSAVKY